ncbi:MAG: hypothetical protein AB2A00_41725 [Myxococcota bacterium]
MSHPRGSGDAKHVLAHLVTVATSEHAQPLSVVQDRKLRLTSWGEIVAECWFACANRCAVACDALLVAPWELRGVVLWDDRVGRARSRVSGLVAIVQQFKVRSTRRIQRREDAAVVVWRPGYTLVPVEDLLDLALTREELLRPRVEPWWPVWPSSGRANT